MSLASVINAFMLTVISKKHFLGMEVQAQTLTGFVILIHSNLSRCKQMADISVRP